MIYFWLAIVIAVLNIPLLMFLLTKLCKKMGWNTAMGGITGLFSGAGLGLLMFFLCSRVYVLKENNEYDHYMVFIGSNYEMSNDTIVSIERKRGSCVIINESETIYIIEEVVYGGYGFSGDTRWIKPMQYYKMDFDRIFYFFDDTPPDQIRIKSDKPVKRYWLRNKRG